MRRIRIVFLLLAALLLVPMGLLVQNALESVAFEREVRHRTVAERVFDEMERELSAVLQRENERPFGHYGFYYVPETVSGTRHAVARSPLSELPAEPYLVGYFQVDPDASFHSPLIPRETAYARALSDWKYSPQVDRAVARVARVVSKDTARASERLAAARASAGALSLAGPAPAKPKPAGERRERGGRKPRPGRDGAEARQQVIDVFEALRALNRGTGARDAQRRIAVKVTRRGDTASIQFRAIDPGEAESWADATLFQWTLPLDADPLPEDDGAVRSVSYDVDAVLRNEAPARSQVATYPMLGRAVDRENLLLFREARIGEAAYLQGLVLDFAALTHWLDDAVLGGTDLALRSRRLFFLGTAPAAADGDGASFSYLHRFATPFGDLGMRIELEPLPDIGGSVYLYVIAALLVVAGVLGLFALYRMVAVTVRYAERRSNFAAAVSHELKTPLTAIRMLSEMLRDGMVASEDKRREYCSTISAESERLTRLIDNVLEFSRLEQGSRAMNLVSGPIGPVVREAAHTLEPHARGAGFSLALEVEEGLPAVRFDRDAVVQVVFNLVDNALKYARSAPEKVIRLHCRREGDTVRLSVRDSGPGVGSQHLGKIFEPFYRGENELTRTTKGTGIGLALVKGLAERMGAAVAGRNAAGGGFEVSLTFRPAAAG